MRRNGKRMLAVAGAVLIGLSPAAQVRAATNEQIIYNYLTNDMGFNTAAAVGVLANIEAESEFDPNKSGDNGTSYGICQWHSSRFKAMKKWCKANDCDYTTIYGQLRYLQQELSYNDDTWLYNGKTIYKYMTNADNVPNTSDGAYEAGRYWCVKYEVPANKTTVSKKRGKRAKNHFWEIYSAETSESDSDSSDGSGSSDVSGSISDKDSAGGSADGKGSDTDSGSSNSSSDGSDGSNSAVGSSSGSSDGTVALETVATEALSSSIYISNGNYPVELVTGTLFTITGTVSSEMPLTEVTAACYDLTGKKKTGKTVTPNATSYNLKNLDEEVYISRLKPGKYIYVVLAQNAEKTDTLIRKTFSVLPNRTSVKSVQSGKKKLKVTWKKVSGAADGYQIQYAAKSSFKNAKTVTVKSKKKLQKAISSLKSGKRYYVRVRAYRSYPTKDASKNIYAKWSKKVSVWVR